MMDYKEMIDYRDIIKNIVRVEMTRVSDTGEGIFDVITEEGYMYQDISEAVLRDLRPELIY